MRSHVFRLDLRLRRRSTLGYAFGLAAYCLIVVAVYPAFKDTTSLDSLSNSTVAALFGVSGSLTSPVGWLNGNIYENFFPLIILLLTMGYGASCIAGQQEDGILGLVASLPMTRTSILGQKVTAMSVMGLVLATTGAICVLAGRAFQLSVSPGNVVAISASTWLLGIDLGVITMAIGATTGRRGSALGIGGAIAAAAYLISSLAPAVSCIRPARFVSILYWSVGNDQLAHGVSVLDWGVLVAVGSLVTLLAMRQFRRLDLS